MIRLAHVWSTDLGLLHSLPYCRPFLARGWEVYAICPPGPRVAVAEREGVRWLPHALERRPALSDLAGARELHRLFREHRFDIVHTHNIKVGLISRVVAAAARVPVVVHTHHGVMFSLDTPLVKRTALAVLERIASLRADLLFVQSREDLDTIVRSGAGAASQVELIGNGVDLDTFRPAAVTRESAVALRRSLGIRDDDVLFFSAGRLVLEKGYAELFEAAAAAALVDPRIRLAVAGNLDADKSDALDAATLERARAAGILVLGERADMVRLYAAADVVVLVSWREGIPRVLMEGAAMGKPLIASDVRGCREVVVTPSGGSLVPARDSAALARTLQRFAQDEGLRRAAGHFNAELARTRYDLRLVVRHVEDAYLRLLDRKGISAF